MRTWTRGEKIGCWSTVVGTITCLAVIYSLSPVQSLVRQLTSDDAEHSEVTGQTADAQLLLEQQRKLFEEQTQAAKAELRRLHDERILLRQQRIDSIAKGFENKDSREYDRIVLHNKCDQQVDVALYYLDLDEKWITRGWWGIAAGDSVTTNAMTRNAYVYFYGENQATGRLWDGAGKQDSIALPVVNSKFDHLAEETFVYENPRTVSFYHRKTGDTWGDHVEAFECFAEAPLN